MIIIIIRFNTVCRAETDLFSWLTQLFSFLRIDHPTLFRWDPSNADSLNTAETPTPAKITASIWMTSLIGLLTGQLMLPYVVDDVHSLNPRFIKQTFNTFQALSLYQRNIPPDKREFVSKLHEPLSPAIAVECAGWPVYTFQQRNRRSLMFLVATKEGLDQLPP